VTDTAQWVRMHCEMFRSKKLCPLATLEHPSPMSEQTKPDPADLVYTLGAKDTASCGRWFKALKLYWTATKAGPRL
jgi:hypothetical protein